MMTGEIYFQQIFHHIPGIKPNISLTFEANLSFPEITMVNIELMIWWSFTINVIPITQFCILR